jgi:MoxR-like ATPase
MKILERTELYNPINNITEPAMTIDEILAMQEEVRNIRVTDEVKKYVVDIVRFTRSDRNAALGVSPRGSIALYKAAKAYAYIYERDYVTPDDVKKTAVSVLAHRIILSPQGRTEFNSTEAYVEAILNTLAVPSMGN